MLALRLEKELDAKLGALAKLKRRNKSELVREAIKRLLEDEEDLELAERVLARSRSSKPLKQLRKELGLDR
ncbi:MAG: type II toxin-antitoxin system RelB family antitoxin [Terriglobales bacterium]